MHILTWNLRGLCTSLAHLSLLLQQFPLMFLYIIEPQQLLLN